jgi:hypothetical protein
MVESRDHNKILQEFEKLRVEINCLRDNIDKSYYSIPKNEFETITVNKITQKAMERISRRISSWRNWAAIIIIILSFFGLTQGDKLIKPIIESKVKENTDVINENAKDLNFMITEAVKDLRKERKDLKKEIDEEFGRISKYIDEKVATAANMAAKQETERQLATLRDDIQLSQKTVLKTELETLINDVQMLTNYKEALIKLNPLLQKAISLNDKELVNEFLDYLFRWTYATRAYEEIDKLRIKYEKDFDFKETTWVNIAISDMNLYDQHYAPIYKKRANSAIDHSLDKLPNYGVPYAVRLIIHMIDYKNMDAQDEKKLEKRETQKLFNIVNSGESLVTSYETYDYLIGNEGTRFHDYFLMLVDNYPEQMKLMEKRYNSYLILQELSKSMPKVEALKKWQELKKAVDEL